jgi:hypothetical protein
MVQIELGRLGFHMGLTGPTLPYWANIEGILDLICAEKCNRLALPVCPYKTLKHRLTGDCSRRWPTARLALTAFLNLESETNISIPSLV